MKRVRITMMKKLVALLATAGLGFAVIAAQSTAPQPPAGQAAPAQTAPRADPYANNAAPGTLAAFLTDRRGLFAADGAGRLAWTAIQHAPWPLQPAEAEIRVDTMAAAHGIVLPDVEPVLSFAKRLDVVAWWPRRLPQD